MTIAVNAIHIELANTATPTNTPTSIPANTPTPAPTDTPPPTPTSTPGGNTSRTTDGLQALYTFQEGNGTTVSDISGVGVPLNLTIGNTDAITWLADGGLTVFSDVLISSSGPATKLINASQATNELTFEAWVQPANTSQNGPARIASISLDTDLRNATLGQHYDYFNARARTTDTTLNGSPIHLDSNAGTASTNLTHVVYSRDVSGTRRIYVDGVEVGSDSQTGDFSTWDSSYKFGLASELDGLRPWLGTFYLVAVYDKALSAAEIDQNFNAGHLYNNTTASFIADKTSGIAPLTVNFTNNSVNADTYHWDFGDGTTSTAESPAHEYDQAGVYTVSLTATGPNDTDISAITDYITVTEDVRIIDGLQALYTFQEGSGATVGDVSGVGNPLDLAIGDTDAVTWLGDGGLHLIIWCSLQADRRYPNIQ
ncbi:MAG: PKD domain-containing protein [Chloroflexi bacterium]|nr:MAG: PKD domain-containing protein [Chloroflexota bacterium]